MDWNKCLDLSGLEKEAEELNARLCQGLETDRYQLGDLTLQAYVLQIEEAQGCLSQIEEAQRCLGLGQIEEARRHLVRKIEAAKRDLVLSLTEERVHGARIGRIEVDLRRVRIAVRVAEAGIAAARKARHGAFSIDGVLPGDDGPSRPDEANPPSHAQFILHLFLPFERQDDVVGDLGQRYGKRLEQYGAGKARLWYWTQTLTLVAATLRERCGGLVKWGAGLEILRRWLGP